MQRRVSLTDEQREEFDQMLHVMQLKRNGAMGELGTPEPWNIQSSCLTSASVSMLKAELNRRGYKVASPECVGATQKRRTPGINHPHTHPPTGSFHTIAHYHYQPLP